MTYLAFRQRYTFRSISVLFGQFPIARAVTHRQSDVVLPDSQIAHGHLYRGVSNQGFQLRYWAARLVQMPAEGAPQGMRGEIQAQAFAMFLQRSEVKGYELKAVSGNYIKVKEILELLEADGIVKLTVEEKPRLVLTYSLTAKGKKVAAKLNELDELIGN